MSDFSVPATDAARQALRPAVAAALSAAPEATVADFLHRTLRPILKLQNLHLLAAVADFLHDHHIPFQGASATERERLVAELLGRNTKLRYTVLGLIVGQLTTAELEFYRAHRPELHRRIMELATRRAQDQTEAVAALLPAL